MKKLIVLIVILGIGVGGYYGWKNWQKANAASAAPEHATTAKVELRSINFAVNAAGEIDPAEQVSVRPEINGKVDQLPVDLGDRLKKGDLLFFGSRAHRGTPERIRHVGIYLGDKLFIHSSEMVHISSLDPDSAIRDDNWIRTLVRARRILPASGEE